MSTPKRRPACRAPTRVYLVSYDNGASYEDHRCTPLFLVSTHEEADRMVQRAAAWIEEVREDLPPSPLEAQAQAELAGTPMSGDEFVRLLDARQDYIKALTPPYGITSLRDAVDPDVYTCNGHLVAGEIAYWSPHWKEEEDAS